MSLDMKEYHDKVRGALWGIFIADALSMPVHWYYDVEALKRDFGTITDYQAPKEPHPNSYMKLGDSGAGPNINDVIGTVICHGLHEKWTDNAHYHAGLAPGENTLNVRCARLVMHGMTNDKHYDPKTFLNEYVKFMTTPGSHNDPYAETFHRAFFTNYAAGVAPEKCSEGTETPGTASISGFTMMLPVVLGTLCEGPQEWKATPRRHLALTHESESLGNIAEIFSDLLAVVVTGRADLKKAVRATAKAMGAADLEVVAASGLSDTDVIHKTFGPSCSVDTALPGVLYLAYVHADSFEDAVLANANAGGDNGGRGPCLGALMGAALGKSGIPARLIDGLKDKDAIAAQIDAFVWAVCGRYPTP